MGQQDFDDELPPLALDIPDDIRELDADVSAYHREQRLFRRRSRWARVLGSPWGVSAPVIVLVVVALGAIGLALRLSVPAVPRAGVAAPLAQPSVSPGAVGGLVPESTLLLKGQLTAARELRPALVLVLNEQCDCEPLLESLAGQTRAYMLRLVLVTRDQPPSSLARFATRAGPQVLAARDVSGSLVAAFDPTSGPAAVLVHSDGVIGDVVRGLDRAVRLESRLSGLDRPGAPSAAGLHTG